MLRPFSRRGPYVTLLQSVRTTITEELPPKRSQCRRRRGTTNNNALAYFSRLSSKLFWFVSLIFFSWAFRHLVAFTPLREVAQLCSRELKQGTRAS